MKLELQLKKQAVASAWPNGRSDCDHRGYYGGNEWPGEICVQVSVSRTGYGGYPTTDTISTCVECALAALRAGKLNLRGTKSSDPFEMGEKSLKDQEILETAKRMLTEAGPETIYWADEEQVFALGPARARLGIVLGVKVSRPDWADSIQHLLEHSTFAGWVSTDPSELTALGSARLAAFIEDEKSANGALKQVILAAARHKAAPYRSPALAKRGVADLTSAEAKLVEVLLGREMRVCDAPEIGLVLRRLAQTPLMAFKPDPGERLDAIGSFGWGRHVRVQVESLGGARKALEVTLVSGSFEHYESVLVIRADGGDVRLWVEVGFARALEGMPPPIASRRRRAALEASSDDDDDGDDGSEGGNYPSTTGNPSGGGRGNTPR